MMFNEKFCEYNNDKLCFTISLKCSLTLERTRYYILQDAKVSQDWHYATFARHYVCIRNRL